MSALLLAVGGGVARASDGAAAAAEPSLLTIEPLKVPIVDHGAVMGRLEVRAMWKAPDEQAADLAQQRLPQLRAALVTAAADHARLTATPGQPIDPLALSRRLQQDAGQQGFSGELLVLEAVARPN